MTIVADHYTHVVGVDTHAASHTLAILDSATGIDKDIAVFPASKAGQKRAVAWIGRHTGAETDKVLISMEGVGSYGAVLAGEAGSAGYRIVEAPAPISKVAVRKGKSDSLDALRAARSVLSSPVGELIEPRTGEIRAALRVLLVAREEMTRMSIQASNALNALLRACDLGIDARKPLTHAQITTIAAWRARDENIHLRVSRTEAVRLARLVISFAEQIKANQGELEKLVRELAPQLLVLTGVGPVVAAAILVAWSHPGRIRSEACFAALAGTSPIPASSGNTIRYRLNRGGDRRLNKAIHTIALVRMRTDDDTKNYVARRVAEGLSKKEIMRVLKRYIARQLYRMLKKSYIGDLT
jgi:transposase